MKKAPAWWRKPRRISVVVDNPSWILPYAEQLVDVLGRSGDDPTLYPAHDEVPRGEVAFYLGCTKITPPDVLQRNRRNLVVHESDLPRGRGFSPLTWQILDGRDEIPICLVEAAKEVDAGTVIYRQTLRFDGHELIDELRDAQGSATVELCLRFLNGAEPLVGIPQKGEPTFFARRNARDSRLDPEQSLSQQFNLLRVVDNQRYPAFFDYRGHRYRISVEKVDPSDGELGRKR